MFTQSEVITMAMDNVRSVSTGTSSTINSVTNNVSKSGSSGDTLGKFKQSFEENSNNKDKNDNTKPVQNMSPAYRRLRKRPIPKDELINQLKYQQNLIKNKIPSEQDNIANRTSNNLQYNKHNLSAKEKQQYNMVAKFYSDIAEEMRYL